MLGAVLAFGASAGPAVAEEAVAEEGTVGAAPDRVVPGDDDGPIEAQIVGGTNATSSAGMAAVLLDGSFICSGSIVDNRWVLTAKHCAVTEAGSKIAASRLSVRVKSLDRTTGGGVVNVSLTKVRTNNDIAMMKLTRSANAEPVRMASANPVLHATTYAFGWGRTCVNCAASTHLKRAVLTYNGIQKDAWGGMALSVVNTGGTGSGSPCFGDSGGPLFKLVDGKRYQVGVLSNGDPVCGGRGDNYASVPHSKEWIEKVMADF
ncbi:trypsin-like serine protease [Streptomyces sp. NPDC093085]|uniref:S1 family peptidase n=1 Tax=Streptomyces sp. NPDC093085 TaxID=3155068 RepID=UPI00342DC034